MVSHLSALSQKARAAPTAVFYTLAVLALKPFVRCELQTGEPPCGRVLCFGWHADLVPGLLASRFLENVAWVGRFSPSSLAMSAPAVTLGLRVLRFDPLGAQSSYVQVLRLINSFGGPVGLFTDADRADRQVRGSLIGLARDSGRELIPMRATATSNLHVNGQEIPLPFSTVRLRIGQGISVRTLEKMTSSEAASFLRAELESL